MGGPGYSIKAEFNDTTLHKRGALSIARSQILIAVARSFL